LISTNQTPLCVPIRVAFGGRSRTARGPFLRRFFFCLPLGTGPTAGIGCFVAWVLLTVVRGSGPFTNSGPVYLKGARPRVFRNPQIELTGTDFSDFVVATAVLATCLRTSTSPTRFSLHSALFPLHPIMSPTRVHPIGVTKPPNNDAGRRNGRRSPGGASSGASSSPSTDPVARARELLPALAGKNQVAQLLAAVPGLTRKSARTDGGGCVVIRAQSAARHCGLHQPWSTTGPT